MIFMIVAQPNVQILLDGQIWLSCWASVCLLTFDLKLGPVKFQLSLLIAQLLFKVLILKCNI